MKNLFFLLIAVPVVSFAQVSYNPFASIGKKANVVTLSNGRYKEMYGGDTVKRIGNILFDVRTEKIVKFLDEGDSTSYLSKNEGDLSTRWLSIDPLAAKYPYLSPYVFVANNPIIYVDQDGRENVIYIVVARSKSGKPEIGTTQVNDIINKANSLLRDNLKVNTRVVLMTEGTIVEKTDNVVAIGTNRSNIQNEISKYSANFANSTEINQWVKDGDVSNPERGNNKISPDKIGGVVDVDDIQKGLMGVAELYSPEFKTEAENNIKKSDANKLTALTIIHASGHAAQYGHNLNELSIMNIGESVQNGIRNGSNVEDRATLPSTERTAWEGRYSTNQASTLKSNGRRPVRTPVK